MIAVAPDDAVHPGQDQLSSVVCLLGARVTGKQQNPRVLRKAPGRYGIASHSRFGLARNRDESWRVVTNVLSIVIIGIVVKLFRHFIQVKRLTSCFVTIRTSVAKPPVHVVSAI